MKIPPSKTFRMTLVHYPEPHFNRTLKIMKAHPEVKDLFGNTPSSAWMALALVVIQFGLAAGISSYPWWLILIFSYGIGAFLNHGLWVLIHDCTHNLIFKTKWTNSLLQIFANLPIIFPSAISFRQYHLRHHLYQGDPVRDADLPRPFEVEWVGNSSVRKTVWYFFFFVFQLLRVPSVKGIELLNRWTVLNWVVVVSGLSALTVYFGWGSFLYLAFSSIFSIGLHPVGARWIQEHYTIFEQQETYSYYGPLNRIAFNVGYHNEHHDFMGVPWSRLPRIREIAPEYYDSLYSHSSWTKLLIRFIRDPELGLFSRITRQTALRNAGSQNNPPARARLINGLKKVASKKKDTVSA